ncbi:chaperone modulator CbpM [Bosea sp. TAF32]|uniref:chaperone modulator CbpM n=1 Tax=Bosea sp. TAF32 TaxID=3237482 RepID=UPI003F8DDDF3
MTKQEFLSSSGIQVQVLDLWLEQRWLIPEEAEAGLLFSEIELARAHLIRQLKDDLGANDEGIDVILHLVDQIHGLRRVLGELREEIKGR